MNRAHVIAPIQTGDAVACEFTVRHAPCHAGMGRGAYALANPDRLTLQVALAQFNGVYATDYPMVMAGTLMSTLPLIVIFVLASRHFIGNIAAGALKN